MATQLRAKAEEVEQVLLRSLAAANPMEAGRLPISRTVSGRVTQRVGGGALMSHRHLESAGGGSCSEGRGGGVLALIRWAWRE